MSLWFRTSDVAIEQGVDKSKWGGTGADKRADMGELRQTPWQCILVGADSFFVPLYPKSLRKENINHGK